MNASTETTTPPLGYYLLKPDEQAFVNGMVASGATYQEAINEVAFQKLGMWP